MMNQCDLFLPQIHTCIQASCVNNLCSYMFTFASSFLVLQHLGICSLWEVDRQRTFSPFLLKISFFLRAIQSLSSQGKLFPFSPRKLFPRGTCLGLPFFFFPAKSIFFLRASSLKKLPIGYFVAFMPFMFSSLSSSEKKNIWGKD